MKTTETKEYRQAMAVAYSIRSRSNKRPSILFLCECLKKMIKGV